MRLIDADKLKEHVNSKSTHPLCEWDTAGVLMAIDERETVETKWIPCKERLPEKDGMYLITADVLGKKKIQYVFFQKDIDMFICNGSAIAWKPLPNPYKE